METNVTIGFAPVSTGKTRGVLTIKQDDRIIFTDNLDIASDAKRAALTKKVCEQLPGIDQNDLNAVMLEYVHQQIATAEQPSTASPEVAADLVVRPHLFHLPEVSGCLVPVTRISGHSPVGEWIQHLHWADGRREVQPVQSHLVLPDSRVLWFAPLPTSPPPGTRSLWSQAARTKWQDGYSPKPDEVFLRLNDEFAHYLQFRPEDGVTVFTVMSLWTMVSYLYTIWPAAPYLYVGGPLGSGKSRLFDVLNQLVFMPLSSCNMTAPCMFRMLHQQGGTVLLDEAEHLASHTPESEELLKILLAGYKKGQSATRLEKVKDGFIPVSFDVYGPKAVAAIQNIPPTLTSRSIRITMFRASKGSPVPRRRIADHATEFSGLRDDLHALALSYGTQLVSAAANDNCIAALGGRDFEVWLPLISIASFLEEHGVKGIVDAVAGYAAKAVEAGREDTVPDLDETVLRIARHLCSGTGTPTPSAILKQAQAEDSATFGRLSPRTVSKVMAKYGLRTSKSNSRRVYRIGADQFRTISESYGFDLGTDDEHSDHAA